MIAGLVLGSVLAVLIPRIGLAPLLGLMGAATFGVASLATVLWILRRSAAEAIAVPGPSLGYEKMSTAALIAAWSVLGLGSLPPVARAIKLATSETPPPPMKVKVPPSPWFKANVVLIGPGGAAVALASDGDPDGSEYRLIATADKTTSERAVDQARGAGVRIVGADPALVMSLMKSVGLGHPIPAEKGVAVARLIFDRKPWTGSDLILTGPDGGAVGLSRVLKAGVKGRGYAIKARSAAGWSDLAAAAGFDAGRQVLEVDRAVLSSLSAASTPIGERVEDGLARAIDALFRTRKFSGGWDYVCFEDIQKRRRRVAICLGIDETTVRLVELADGASQAAGDPSAPDGPAASPRVEIVPRSRIPANSLRILKSEDELREATDLLDYMLHRLAGKLDSAGPVALRLAVLPTTVVDPATDALKRQDADRNRLWKELGNSKEAVRYKVLSAYLNDGPGSLARYGPGVRMAADAQVLAGEIREGLASMRIEMLEPQGPDPIEMALRGLEALIPPGDVDLRARMRNAATKRQLLGATHVLASEIAPATERGRYHLSLRLFEIDGGKLIYAEQGDRREGSLAVLGSELAAYPYLLNTGEVCLLDFGDKVRMHLPREITTMPGGLPLRLGDDYRVSPMKGNEHTFWELSRKKQKPEPRELALFGGYPVPNGIYARLGYREKGSPGDDRAIIFRDLFGRRVEDIPVDSIRAMEDSQKRGTSEGATPAPSFGSIPYAHQMRYIVWMMAKAALPVAGRVGGQSGEAYRVNMGKDHRLKPKDRLVVRRPGLGDLPDRILATELIVAQVEDDYVRAIPAPDQATLPGAEEARSGDIVQRKPTEKIRVAVAPPSVIVEPPPVRRPGSPRGTPPPFVPRASEVGPRLAEMIAGGLREVGVPMVESRELDRVLKAQGIGDVERQLKLLGQTSVATHILVGNITPGPAYTMTNLKMVEVASGDVVATISGYHFTRATQEAWKQ